MLPCLTNFIRRLLVFLFFFLSYLLLSDFLLPCFLCLSVCSVYLLQSQFLNNFLQNSLSQREFLQPGS